MLRQWLQAELKPIQSAHEAIWIGEYLENQSSSLVEQRKIGRELLERRFRGEPLAYIFGEWEFLDHSFKLGPGVLIPRPETEELVLLVVEELYQKYKHKNQITIADFGAGSGCLGLSVAAALLQKLPKIDLKLQLIESSKKACFYLKKNSDRFVAEGLLAAKNICFFAKDWSFFDQKIDVLLSNPPYLSQTEYGGLDRSVKNFEPREALFFERDNGDGLESYRELLRLASKLLKLDGRLYFELGFEQAQAVENILKDNLNLVLAWTRKDLCQKQRFLSAYRK